MNILFILEFASEQFTHTFLLLWMDEEMYTKIDPYFYPSLFSVEYQWTKFRRLKLTLE
jgi:hypothetical protein